MRRKLLWLVYKRLRPSLGISFGFVLMFAVLVHNVSLHSLLIAFAFMLIHLFGDCFNDYHDIEEDARNRRNDKLILNGVISSEGLRNLSVVFSVVGLGLLSLVEPVMLIPGLFYVFLGFTYSHPKIRLKRFNLPTYMFSGSMWILTFLLLSIVLSGGISTTAALFALFAFSQYVYILCQKDSTDREDFDNLFISRGWRTSFGITTFFGGLSSALLLMMSLFNPVFFLIWAFNFFSKVLNIDSIRRHLITRSARSKLVASEFLMPYLYVGGGLIL
jgi:4-hydroxybenzoate polyprenyltransferase